MAPTDAVLVADARQGNAGALATLLDRHRPGLTAIAVSMVGHGPDVEDIVHETFLRALTGVQRIRDPDAAGPWLMGIARNLCLQRIRAAREVPFGTIESVYRSTDPVQPDEAIDRLALRDWVWSALETLSEPLRLAVILRHFSRSSSYRDIAAISSVPVGTIRSRLNQARAKLAEALRDEAARFDPDHGTLTRTRHRHFQQIFAEYNQGDALETFAATLDPDVESVFEDGSRLRGIDGLVRGLKEDMAVGVKLNLERVIASRSITVLEGAFENPTDHPEHCPAATTQVYLHDGDAIRSIRIHYGSA